MTHSMVAHLAFHLWTLIAILLAISGHETASLVAFVIPVSYLVIPWLLLRRFKSEVHGLTWASLSKALREAFSGS